MEISTHELVNKLLPPDAGTEDWVSPLPIFETTTENGICSTSFWKPNDEELKILNAGGCVSVEVYAADELHPAIGVGAVVAASILSACWSSN